MGKSRQQLAIRSVIGDGENVLVAVNCSPPGVLERQQSKQLKVVVTDRRLIAVRLGRILERKVKETILDLPLADIVGVQTQKRYPVGTYGIPILRVTITLRGGDGIAFENGGFGIKRGRALAAALEDATKAASTDQSILRQSPRDPTSA